VPLLNFKIADIILAVKRLHFVITAQYGLSLISVEILPMHNVDSSEASPDPCLLDIPRVEIAII
jgi:hypothetical protein